MRWLFYVNLLLVGLFSLSVEKAETCTCLPEHPQTHFCNSDFVAKVQVKALTRGIHGNKYTVKVKKVFKSLRKYNFTSEEKLWTSSSDSLCGVSLNVNKSYVVSGRVNFKKLIISTCDLLIPWTRTTNRQRKGFRQLYRKGCKCEITYTSFLRKGTVLKNARGKQCLWEAQPGPMECQEQYGICMQGEIGCSWVPSVPYMNCIEEHQRQREQHGKRDSRAGKPPSYNLQ